MFREKEKTGGTGDTKEKYQSIVIKGINDNENAIRAEKESNNPKHEITKPTSKELFKKNGNKPENLEKKNSSAKNVPEKKGEIIKVGQNWEGGKNRFVRNSLFSRQDKDNRLE